MNYFILYNRSVRRYEDACYEINRCNNKIKDLKSQRQSKINQINQLKTDIKNNQEAYEGMIKIIKAEESLNKNVRNIDKKSNDATDNYTGMVRASDITLKKINDVYMEEMNKTNTILNKILSTLKTKKDALHTRIIDLKSQLRRAESDLKDIEDSIKRTESALNDWERKKRSASIDMDYYGRKMEQED